MAALARQSEAARRSSPALGAQPRGRASQPTRRRRAPEERAPRVGPGRKGRSLRRRPGRRWRSPRAPRSGHAFPSARDSIRLRRGSWRAGCRTARSQRSSCSATRRWRRTSIGGSQFVFSGNPGKLVNGTGIYQGATGRTISSKELAEDASDVVLRIQLAPW